MIKAVILVAFAALAALLLLLPLGCDASSSEEMTGKIIEEMQRSVPLGSTREQVEHQLQAMRTNFHSDVRSGELLAARRSVCRTWLVDVGVQFTFIFDKIGHLNNIRAEVLNSGP